MDGRPTHTGDPLMAFSFFLPRRHVKTDGVFTKCRQCAQMVRVRDVEEGLDVCPACGFHFPIGAQRRIQITADEGSFEELFTDIWPCDPLEFNAKKAYSERLRQSQQSAGLADAVCTGAGNIKGKRTAVGVTDHRFMMGSMGSVVGEKIALLTEYALENNLPLVIFSGSGGGARMDEGVLSLMQMAKTSAALGKFQKAGLLPGALLRNAGLRFDPAKQMLYVKPVISDLQASSTTAQGDINDILMAYLNNREFPVKMQQMEPLIAETSGKTININMNIVGIHTRQGILQFDILPHIQSQNHGAKKKS